MVLNFDNGEGTGTGTGTGAITGILALLLPLYTVAGSVNSSGGDGGAGGGGRGFGFVGESRGGVITDPLLPVSEASNESDEVLIAPAICPPICSPNVPVPNVFSKGISDLVGVAKGVGGTGREGLKSSPLSKKLGFGLLVCCSVVFGGGLIEDIPDEEGLDPLEGEIYGPLSFRKPRGGVLGGLFCCCCFFGRGVAGVDVPVPVPPGGTRLGLACCCCCCCPCPRRDGGLKSGVSGLGEEVKAL